MLSASKGILEIISQEWLSGMYDVLRPKISSLRGSLHLGHPKGHTASHLLQSIQRSWFILYRVLLSSIASTGHIELHLPQLIHGPMILCGICILLLWKPNANFVFYEAALTFHYYFPHLLDLWSSFYPCLFKAHIIKFDIGPSNLFKNAPNKLRH